MDDDFADRRQSLLSPRQVAARLGVSMTHVYALIRDGSIPVTNVGLGGRNVWRIHPADLDTFVADRR